FNIPFSRNDHFTGQEQILDSIHKNPVTKARQDRTSSYVLYGLGGVGKTQIAIEYSYRRSDYFDIVHLRYYGFQMSIANIFKRYCRFKAAHWQRKESGTLALRSTLAS